MGRGDQLGRQWRIIQTLISSRKGKSEAGLVNDPNSPENSLRDIGGAKRCLALIPTSHMPAF